MTWAKSCLALESLQPDWFGIWVDELATRAVRGSFDQGCQRCNMVINMVIFLLVVDKELDSGVKGVG